MSAQHGSLVGALCLDRDVIQQIIAAAWLRCDKTDVIPIRRPRSAAMGKATLTTDALNELMLVTYSDPQQPCMMPDALPAMVIKGGREYPLNLRRQSKVWVVGFNIHVSSPEEALSALRDNLQAFPLETTAILQVV